MKGKVNCTCGWSWNKSDSSAKDMYICHECGRDNSNNMKNGGWLDNYGKQANYNDSKATASPDMVGDGFSNVGRNYSPAWGGQFEEGGEIPNAQNGWLEKIDNVLSAPARAATYAVEAGAHAIGARKTPPKYEDPSDGLGIDEKNHPYLKLATDIVLDPTNLLGVGAISKIGKLAKGVKTVQKTKNVLNPTVNATLSAAEKALQKAHGPLANVKKMFSPEMKKIRDLAAKRYDRVIVEEALKLGAKDGIGTIAIINDLIKQHPDKKEEILKNYKNITKQNTSKKPQEQVIIKDPNAPQYKTIHTGEGEGRFELVQRPNVKAIQNNLKPEGLIQSNTKLSADMSGLKSVARIPKYYDVQENINQPFGGSQTNYRTSDLNSITSPDDLGPGNTRKIVPHYAMGGSIPGSVGFTYARTKGIPSNGPYAKKTLASAQNGVDMYGNPIIAKENYIKGAGRSNYKPRTNISNLYDLDPRYNHTRAHENYHARQFAEGRSNFDIGHNTENALWAAMQKRPEITSTEEVFESFHNRKQKEMEMDRPDMVNIVPETRFMPSRLIDKYIDRNGLQYRNPNSMEGEAEYYGDLGEEYYKIPKGQNGMEMKYYQNGLDFKPKSISRDGGWLNKYDVAQNGKKKFKLKDERLQAIRPSESTFVKKPNFEAEQAKVQRTYVDQVGKQMAEEKRRKKLTKDQREREDYNARNEQTGSIQTPVEESIWDRTKAIVSNPLTAFGYAARNESLPTRFQFGERNTLDNAIDWINPLQGAAALSEIPGELGRGEFLNAGLSALDAADLGVYAKGAKQLRNINPEGKIFNGLNKQLDDIAIKNTERYMAKRTPSNTPLSKEMNPQLLDNFDPGEYTPFQEDDYMKWFNAQKDKLNPRPVKQDPRSIVRRSSVININDMKEGGVIKDDRGQWEHPGEITEIGSNQITMQGVPYPVLGISNTGDVQMMYPDGEYEYDGESVTEFPMAQNGSKLDFNNLPKVSDFKKKPLKLKSEKNNVVKESTKVNKNTPTKVKQKKQFKPLDDTELAKLNIPEQVTDQISHNIYWGNDKQNYGIIDKENNVMYYVNPEGKIIGSENVITGATNKDEENAPSMLEYGKTANEYYDYLKNTNQRVTPAGVFTLHSNKNDSYGKPHSLIDRVIGSLPFVDDVKLNTLDDPSLMHAIYNEMPWREEEKKEYYDHRKESYGPTGNMFRMVSQYGVPSSKGMHGTGNTNRIAALNSASADKNLSNGCINVGGKTICNDILKDKSKLYILPEVPLKYTFDDGSVMEEKGRANIKEQKYTKFGHYDDDKQWKYDKDKPISREYIQSAKATKNKVTDIIRNNKIKATPEEIDFVAAVAQKETKGGKSFLSQAESILPGFSSYGLYEQKEDFPFLKGKSPNDEVASTQAVIDFYRSMMSKHPELEYEDYGPEKIYSTYTSGKEDWNDTGIYYGPEFRKSLQAVKGYKNGGNINQQDQKTLEHLDQLTNFTNYNKQQPAGWLSKYN